MDLELLSFLTVSLVIALTPGPSVIYVVSYSLRYGSRAGVVSTLGVNAGSIVFILMAGFGLAALLDVYPQAIILIQLLGGFYVIYLAIKMWPRGSAVDIDEQGLLQWSYKNLFLNGFITSVLNPKDMLFYTAFIPTFIPSQIKGDSYRTHFMLLAFAYITIGFLTKSLFAVFAGQSKSALNSKFAVYVNYLSALTLLALGVFLTAKSAMSLLPFRIV